MKRRTGNDRGMERGNDPAKVVARLFGLAVSNLDHGLHFGRIGAAAQMGAQGVAPDQLAVRALADCPPSGLASVGTRKLHQHV